jgi:AcrR family transcriptional regulator
VHDRQVKDRRVQKTRTLLVEALGSLIHEKPYGAIVVREILERANVGRSTFYMHFRGKDELLVSGIQDMLGLRSATLPSASRSERVIQFSLPIFEHIEQHRRTSEDKMGIPDRAVVHERLRRVLGDRIADEVGQSIHERGTTPSRMPRELLVEHVASSFIVVLDWWLDSRSPLSASEVNELFRALVLPTLDASLG